MMKKMNKILAITCLLIVMMQIVCMFQFEAEAKALTYQDMMKQTGDFISKGKKESDGIPTGDIAEQFVNLGQVLTMVGTGVFIAAVTFMGIKYLTSGPEAQAKLKEQLIGLIVSGVVIFGAYGIWKLVLGIVEI